MYGEGDVYVRLRAARVELNGAVARHTYQVPFAVRNETTDVSSVGALFHEIQLRFKEYDDVLVVYE